MEFQLEVLYVGTPRRERSDSRFAVDSYLRYVFLRTRFGLCGQFQRHFSAVYVGFSAYALHREPRASYTQSRPLSQNPTGIPKDAARVAGNFHKISLSASPSLAASGVPTCSECGRALLFSARVLEELSPASPFSLTLLRKHHRRSQRSLRKVSHRALELLHVKTVRMIPRIHTTPSLRAKLHRRRRSRGHRTAAMTSPRESLPGHA